MIWRTRWVFEIRASIDRRTVDHRVSVMKIHWKTSFSTEEMDTDTLFIEMNAWCGPLRNSHSENHAKKESNFYERENQKKK